MIAAKKNSLPRLAPSSIRHRVLTALRNAIINGDLKPGQRLTEEDICAQMAVSRGPVREAMRELELEGMIISEPYKGAEVLDISDREVMELLMPIRLALEEFGFSIAIKNATPEDFAELERIVERMASAAKRDDVGGVIQADSDFHEAILQISQQVHCLQIWRTISPRVKAYFSRWRQVSPNLNAEVAEHRRLLEDFQSGDFARLHKRLRKHILAAPKVSSDKSAGRRRAARRGSSSVKQ